jgi:hypothetical protein
LYYNELRELRPILTPFHRELAGYETGERLRRAERLRLARDAPRRSLRRALRVPGWWTPWARSRVPSPAEAEIRIRFATERDRATWPELEWRTPEQVLVADVDGAPRAALSLVDGAVLGRGGREDAAPF